MTEVPTWNLIDINRLNGYAWINWMEAVRVIRMIPNDTELRSIEDCVSVGFFQMYDEEMDCMNDLILVDGESAPKNWTWV